MIRRYAEVDQNEVVVNVVLWDGEEEFQPEGSLERVPVEVGIGWARVAGQWTPPQTEEQYLVDLEQIEELA